MSRVKHRVGIQGSAKSIYACLTTNSGLEGWWATSVSGFAEVGNVIELEFSNLAVLSFKYEKLTENKSVSLKCETGPGPWLGSTLLFELNESDQQIFVTLTHENKDPSEDDFLYFSTKWAVYLISLKQLVERGKGMPYPQDIKIHVGD